jgi:RHS repeat-associated protein
MQGAGGVGGLLEETFYGSSTTNCFVAFDGNGNVASLVNAAVGTVSANYEYDPFGQVIRATGLMAKANPFRFSTKYQDDESGLNYYGYRFYNPNGGRWPNRDPIGERGGLNLYDYVANNPINAIDSLGLWQETVTVGDGLGGMITFGNNGGQWNVGAQVGPIEGLSSSLDPTDSGSSPSGFSGAAQTSVTLPVGVTGTVSDDPDGGSISISHPVAGGPVAINGGTDGIKPSLDLGESAGATGGFSFHFHKKPTRIWECQDKTGIYMKASPTSPGPAWTLVRTIEQ